MSKFRKNFEITPENLSKIREWSQNILKEQPSLSNKLQIVLTEIFENVLHHDHLVDCMSCQVHIKKRQGIYVLDLLTIYQPKQVNFFIPNLEHRSVYFSHNENRYRGLGINMCYNTSDSLHYRFTKNYAAIYLKIISESK